MSAAHDPFNFSAMATNLAAPPAAAAGNQAPQSQYSQPQQYEQPPQQQQLVVATQPSNPYAGFVAPQQPQQHQASPWDAPAPQAAPNSNFVAPPPTSVSTTSPTSFDPFAAVPQAPPPAPFVAQAPPQQQQQLYSPAPPQQQQQQPYSAAPNPSIQDPWATAPPSHSVSAPQQQQQYQAPAPASYETQVVPAQPHQAYPNQGLQPSYSNDNYPANNQSYGNTVNDRQIVPASSGDNDRNYENNKSQRNPYSAVIAQQVQGTKASNLPKAELVGKKGYVLSRISFRTIVMKKWKQSFWVQYGGHTMLWFRSQADFDDWINNPYHTQMQRNFLIKLAINFVHDLYKPNVRGYQVTQCRTKPYGKNEVIRQFKLERWMDYGPTIAAAFGSRDPREVDACRAAIVECMKNTPLDNGIRATGAVKEHHERKHQQEWRKAQEKQQTESGQHGGQHQSSGNGGYNNYSMGNNQPGTTVPRSNSLPGNDLLGGGHDVNDSVSVPPGTYGNSPTGDLLGDIGAGVLVPAVNPNQSYPGAPPAPAGNVAQPAFYPTAQPQMQHPAHTAQSQTADHSAYGAQAGAPTPQAYPQYQQQQQQQYQVQAPAPAFAQPPQPQQNGGYGYPAASYPVQNQQY